MSSDSGNSIPLDDQWSSSDVINMLCDPFVVFDDGVPEDTWVKGVCKLVRDGEEGETLESVYRRVIARFDEGLNAKGEVDTVISDGAWDKFKAMADTVPLEVAFQVLLRNLRYGYARLAPLFQSDEDLVTIHVPRELAIEMARLQIRRAEVFRRHVRGEEVTEEEIEYLRSESDKLLGWLCIRDAEKFIEAVEADKAAENDKDEDES